MVVCLNGKWDYLNNTDKGLADSLAMTFTDLTPDNMNQATRHLFDIFEVVAKKYCEKEGKPFPQEKVVAMRKLFDEFDLAER